MFLNPISKTESSKNASRGSAWILSSEHEGVEIQKASLKEKKVVFS